MDTYGDTADRGGRLVKVLLPPAVVRAMDSFIEHSAAYDDRSQFISDAVQGHLAEIGEATVGEEVTDFARPMHRTEPVEIPVGSVGSLFSGVLPRIEEDVPTLSAPKRTSNEPTWGMHNRDFPTLWAAAHLAAASIRDGVPPIFGDWLDEVVSMAWELPSRLPRQTFDISGFPTNPAKREASEGRFVRFFIGEEPEVGPLFELGLAASDRGRIALTDAGVRLMRRLAGFGCRIDAPVQREWTESYFRHLARWAPADFSFIRELLLCVDKGHEARAELVQVVADLHPNWSGAVCETNVAGYIARGREWGLVARKQRNARYVLESGAIALLDSISQLDLQSA